MIVINAFIRKAPFVRSCLSPTSHSSKETPLLSWRSPEHLQISVAEKRKTRLCMSLGYQEKETSRKHWRSNLLGPFIYLLIYFNTVKEEGEMYRGYF